MDSRLAPDKPSSSATAPVAATSRLLLRHLGARDGGFVLQQLNQAGWLRYIGDRGVRNLDDAREYLRSRFLAEYEQLGFGMYGIELRSTGQLVGVCGLVQRDWLDAPDLGFALLDDQAGHGYAHEAAVAVMHHAHAELQLPRILGICKADNRRSIALLERLGFTASGVVAAPPAQELLQLYVHDRDSPPERSKPMPLLVTHRGGCHCGRVRFEVDAPAQLRVADCNCSICAKSGFLHLIVERPQFRLLAGEDALISYTFNTGTARHLFCKVCGVKSFYVPRSHPDGYSVNARCLEAGTMTEMTVKPFDGRNWEQNRATPD